MIYNESNKAVSSTALFCFRPIWTGPRSRHQAGEQSLRFNVQESAASIMLRSFVVVFQFRMVML